MQPQPQQQQPHPGRRSAPRSIAWGSLAFMQREGAAGEDQQLVIVEDIGPGGLLLVTSDLPPVGSLLHLLIYSQAGPRGSAAIRVKAVVRWHRLSPLPKGVGVQILGSDDPDQPQLASWLASWPKTATSRTEETRTWLDLD
jgi:PilZ domain